MVGWDVGLEVGGFWNVWAKYRSMFGECQVCEMCWSTWMQLYIDHLQLTVGEAEGGTDGSCDQSTTSKFKKVSDIVCRYFLNPSIPSLYEAKRWAYIRRRDAWSAWRPSWGWYRRTSWWRLQINELIQAMHNIRCTSTWHWYEISKQKCNQNVWNNTYTCRTLWRYMCRWKNWTLWGGICWGCWWSLY